MYMFYFFLAWIWDNIILPIGFNPDILLCINYKERLCKIWILILDI